MRKISVQHKVGLVHTVVSLTILHECVELSKKKVNRNIHGVQNVENDGEDLTICWKYWLQ